MKSIIALFLIVAAALCVSAQQPHCLSNQFTANILLMDPKKHYDDFHKVYFDSASQQQRLDIHELDPQDKHVSVFLKYNSGKMYIFDQVTQSCTTHPLEGKLPSFCLASNATKVDQIMIGGTLKADVWEEKLFGWTTRLVMASDNYVPINVFARGGHLGNAVFEEWVDYTSSVPSNVFNLPSPCLNLQDAKRSNFEDASVPRLLEQVNKISAPFTKKF